MSAHLSSRSLGRPKNDLVPSDLAPSGGGSEVRAGGALSYRRAWRVLGWLLVLVTVWFSLTPRPPMLNVDNGDKVGHFLAYAGLMFWWAALARRRWRAALFLLLLGLAMEIAQGFTPNREPSLLDMLANSLGVAGGLLVSHLLPDWLLRLDARLRPHRV